MFKKVLSTVLLIVMVFAVSLPCSAAVVTDGEKFYVLGDANGDGTMDIRDLVRVKRYKIELPIGYHSAVTVSLRI